MNPSVFPVNNFFRTFSSPVKWRGHVSRPGCLCRSLCSRHNASECITYWHPPPPCPGKSGTRTSYLLTWNCRHDILTTHPCAAHRPAHPLQQVQMSFSIVCLAPPPLRGNSPYLTAQQYPPHISVCTSPPFEKSPTGVAAPMEQCPLYFPGLPLPTKPYLPTESYASYDIRPARTFLWPI